MPQATWTCGLCYDGTVKKGCDAVIGEEGRDPLLFCSRPWGHPGNHVACGDSAEMHVLASWRDVHPTGSRIVLA